MTGSSERRLAAILIADVAGYSRLMHSDEEGTVVALRRLVEMAATIIEKHQGQVVDTAGDGILATFPSAVRALDGAVALQRAVKAESEGVPAEKRVQIRIGLTVGDVVVEGD